MRIFLTKWFSRYAGSERIAVESLIEAVERLQRGLVDADLGGGLFKQRVARTGKGRSGGYRTLIAFQRGERTVFLYAFAKSERENISPSELETLRDLSGAWLEADAGKLSTALADRTIVEIQHGIEDAWAP